MRRNTIILVIFVAVAVTAGTLGILYYNQCYQPKPADGSATASPEPTSSVKKARIPSIYPEVLDHEEVKEYLRDNLDTETESINELDIIPYYEADILFENMIFWFGEDRGRDYWKSSRIDSFRTIVAYFPNPVIRQSPDKKYIYLVYETDKGTRLFVFFLKEEEPVYIVGIPLIMKYKLSYKDFENLMVGDFIDKVESIDYIASLYRQQFNLRYHDDIVEYFRKKRGIELLFTVHLLADGILKIEYDRVDEDKYVVKDILFRSDFTLPGIAYETCYRIQEGDYKE
jgi:hypothetical protein